MPNPAGTWPGQKESRTPARTGRIGPYIDPGTVNFDGFWWGFDDRFAATIAYKWAHPAVAFYPA